MADTKNSEKPSTASVKSKVEIPNVKDMFKAGVQFGHETRRWNPKMRNFLYDIKGNIHIIDVTKTEAKLKEAVNFLSEAASRGNVLFVGTKKQAANIVKDNAVNCGAHFIDQRWAGGLLTNFKKVRESFARLRELETLFEKGVEGRTKYEVSLMKKEWAKLSRLYSGVKTLENMPTAMVIIDTNFEKNAVAEAVRMGIPIVGIIDSNSNPDAVDYPIPANDDAISSITLLVKTLAAATREGNKDGGVKHHLKDYSKAEVQIIKKDMEAEKNVAAVDFDIPEGQTQRPVAKRIVKSPARETKSKSKSSSKTKGGQSKGILEKVQEEKEKKKKN